MTNEVCPNLVSLQEAVNIALEKFDVEDFAARVWKKDPTLWTANPTAQTRIAGRLGWLDLPNTLQSRTPDLLELAQTIKEEGFKQIVLLCLDNSSLGGVALVKAIGNVSGYPELVAVDATHPAFSLDQLQTLNYGTALFVISSASGSLDRLPVILECFERISAGRGQPPGESFIAITSPATPLERLARQHKFREIFLNPPGISELYLALAFSGLVPAALAGYNVREMLRRAAIMAEECRKPGLDNPGLHLGCIIGSSVLQGRPQTRLILSPPLEDFGLWVNRLLAESPGQTPATFESPAAPEAECLFVSLQLSGLRDSQGEEWLKKLEEASHPVVRLRLQDLADLAAEFFRWEFAILAAATVLGINPFE
jgi:glucose-6-phosphate isomerase